MQLRFDKMLCDLRLGGERRVQTQPDHCRTGLAGYLAYRDQLHPELFERAGQQTAAEKLQARVVKLVEAPLAERVEEVES